MDAGIIDEHYKRRAREITVKHIARVQSLIGSVVDQLLKRADVHDQSKFDDVELWPLARMQELIDTEGQAPYGSPEYKRRTDMLGPMTKHHYANNSHHPEHYPNGVNGMDLLDLIEMVCDWKAASERGEESSIGLAHSIERFKIEPQLAEILANTIKRQGWKAN